MTRIAMIQRAAEPRRSGSLPLRAALFSAALIGFAGCTEETTPSAGTGTVTTAQTMAYGLDISLEAGDLAADQPDTARLFVYLREPGERMPIAVTQFPASAIPPTVQFELDRPYARVEAVARLSASGTVTAQPADLETLVTTAVTHPPTTVAMSLMNARAPGPAPAAPASSITATPAANGLSITVEFAIRGELPADTTVFVVAKAPDSPMPVAVKRLQFGDLPTVVTLTDADSMIPTRRISTTSGLTVSAHISRSGNAGRRPGDWIGQGVQDPDNAENFTVTIDQSI